MTLRNAVLVFACATLGTILGSQAASACEGQTGCTGQCCFDFPSGGSLCLDKGMCGTYGGERWCCS